MSAYYFKVAEKLNRFLATIIIVSILSSLIPLAVFAEDTLPPVEPTTIEIPSQGVDGQEGNDGTAGGVPDTETTPPEIIPDPVITENTPSSEASPVAVESPSEETPETTPQGQDGADATAEQRPMMK